MTLTTTPARRARSCGSTACVIAITPNVLVSNTSRIVAIGVASNAPISPMPALLTSTSIGPASATTAAIDAGCVTSSGRTRRRVERGSSASVGVRIVAITCQP